MRPRNARLDARLHRLLRVASLAGADEVGRGCLAGPVVVAAVQLPPGQILRGVRDSKKLPRRRREELSREISRCAVDFALLFVQAAEVDRLNILQASLSGMRIVIERVGAQAALIDGHLLPPALRTPALALVRGDDRSQSIAAASILAKVSRDRFMRAMDRRYPVYGFARHVGYPTAEHLAALREFGPCPLHRTSFAPVAAALREREAKYGVLPELSPVGERRTRARR